MRRVVAAAAVSRSAPFSGLWRSVGVDTRRARVGPARSRRSPGRAEHAVRRVSRSSSIGLGLWDRRPAAPPCRRARHERVRRPGPASRCLRTLRGSDSRAVVAARGARRPDRGRGIAAVRARRPAFASLARNRRRPGAAGRWPHRRAAAAVRRIRGPGARPSRTSPLRARSPRRRSLAVRSASSRARGPAARSSWSPTRCWRSFGRAPPPRRSP